MPRGKKADPTAPPRPYVQERWNKTKRRFTYEASARGYPPPPGSKLQPSQIMIYVGRYLNREKALWAIDVFLRTGEKLPSEAIDRIGQGLGRNNPHFNPRKPRTVTPERRTRTATVVHRPAVAVATPASGRHRLPGETIQDWIQRVGI